MVNWGSAATGALTGAGTGSAFGPWGALTGGLLGGALGLFSGNSGSSRSSSRSSQPMILPRYTRKQRKISRQLANEVLTPDDGPGFDDIYGEYDFDKMRSLYEGAIRDPATRAFQEKTIPAITGSFRAGNLHRSSLMSDALARAGRDLETDIQNQISSLLAQGYERNTDRRAAGYESKQARRDRAREFALGQTEFDYRKPDAPKASWFENLISGLAPEAGKIFSNYAANKLNSGGAGKPGA